MKKETKRKIAAACIGAVGVGILVCQNKSLKRENEELKVKYSNRCGQLESVRKINKKLQHQNSNAAFTLGKAITVRDVKRGKIKF